MDREWYQAEIETFQQRQVDIWAAGLEKYLESKRCKLGLCGKMNDLDLLAKTAAKTEDREDARRLLDSELGKRDMAWNRVAQQIEQIEITIAKLRERADGRL